VHDALQSASGSLGAAFLQAGRIKEAVSHLEVAVAAGTSSSSVDPFALVSLGEAYLNSKRREEALACAARALAFSHEHGQRGNEAHVERFLGHMASEHDRISLTEAETHYRDALAIAEDLGMRPLVADCHLGFGKLYSRVEQHEEARKHLTIATTMYREMGMMHRLDQADRARRELA
jgi:tetratricopeptide (TPR) repeat protein